MLTIEWVVDLICIRSIWVAEFSLYLFTVVLALVSQDCEWRWFGLSFNSGYVAMYMLCLYNGVVTVRNGSMAFG
jgi:hypothetical protein